MIRTLKENWSLPIFYCIIIMNLNDFLLFEIFDDLLEFLNLKQDYSSYILLVLIQIIFFEQIFTWKQNRIQIKGNRLVLASLLFIISFSPIIMLVGELLPSYAEGIGYSFLITYLITSILLILYGIISVIIFLCRKLQNHS